MRENVFHVYSRPFFPHFFLFYTFKIELKINCISEIHVGGSVVWFFAKKEFFWHLKSFSEFKKASGGESKIFMSLIQAAMTALRHRSVKAGNWLRSLRRVPYHSARALPFRPPPGRGPPSRRRWPRSLQRQPHLVETDGTAATTRPAGTASSGHLRLGCCCKTYREKEY